MIGRPGKPNPEVPGLRPRCPNPPSRGSPCTPATQLQRDLHFQGARSSTRSRASSINLREAHRQAAYGLGRRHRRPLGERGRGCHERMNVPCNDGFPRSPRNFFHSRATPNAEALFMSSSATVLRPIATMETPPELFGCGSNRCANRSSSWGERRRSFSLQSSKQPAWTFRTADRTRRSSFFKKSSTPI